ncbi:hypothetical protein ES703_56741 [subsurface metagenome]
MSLFEILILTALLLYLVGFFFPRRKRLRLIAYLTSLSVIFTVAHLILENYRWYLVVAAAILILFPVVHLSQPTGPTL